MNTHPIIESVRSDIEGLDFADDDKRQNAEDSIICTVQTLIDHIEALEAENARLVKDLSRKTANVRDLAHRKVIAGEYRDDFKARAIAAEADREALGVALAPFAEANDLFNSWCPDETHAWYIDGAEPGEETPSPVTVGDFRRARALTQGGGKGEGQ